MEAISYLTLYFLDSAVNMNLTAIFNFTILTAVIAYPFILFGKNLHKQTKSENQYIHWFLTTTVVFLVAWFLLNVYNVIVGNGFAFNLIGIIFAIIFIYIIVLIARKIKELIDFRYDMPEKLNLLIISFVGSLIAWVIIFGMFYLNYGVIA